MLGECSPKIKCVVPNKKDIKYHLILTEVYVSNIETAILKAEQRCRDRVPALHLGDVRFFEPD